MVADTGTRIGHDRLQFPRIVKPPSCSTSAYHIVKPPFCSTSAYHIVKPPSCSPSACHIVKPPSYSSSSYHIVKPPSCSFSISHSKATVLLSFIISHSKATVLLYFSISHSKATVLPCFSISQSQCHTLRDTTRWPWSQAMGWDRSSWPACVKCSVLLASLLTLRRSSSGRVTVMWTRDNNTFTFSLSRKIQTHKRFKRRLYIRTKHNMQMFWVVPFIKLQNDT